MEGLQAEGVLCGVGAHGQPIYREGPFADMDLFDQFGCARKGSLYEGEIDYSKMYCPNAERVYAEEVCSFSHALFLGGVGDMERILEAFHKLRENADELKH